MSVHRGRGEPESPSGALYRKVLHDSGLLDRDKRGVWVYYSARTEALASLGTLMATPGPQPGT